LNPKVCSLLVWEGDSKGMAIKGSREQCW